MQLYDIVSNLKFVGIRNYKDLEINSLTCVAQEKTENSIYFCINGTRKDGHNFVKEAIENGSVCLVVEKFLDMPITQILVEDARVAMSCISSIFFKTYQSKMKFIGITGTNGKTTTTYILKAILSHLGHKVGLIGTIGNYIGNLMLPANLTTPDPIELHKLISDMDANACNFCVMEISAHSIALNKIDNIFYDCVGLTNITQDHLDFFINMDNYAKCKASLFSCVHAKSGVVNVGDQYCKKIADNSSIDVLTIGENEGINLIDEKCTINGSEFSFMYRGNIYSCKTNLIGYYNIQNLLMAVGLLVKLGFDINQLINTVGNIDIVVPGRFNILNTSSEYKVVIDYAHTPDGVKNVLTAIRDLGIGRIITVFGCGGDRDRTKRSEMGAIAEQLSDEVVVTSDNPRSENAQAIIDDILANNPKERYRVVVNREQAINKALSIAEAGDVVAILGKGVEDYQEINGVKYPFSDYAVVDKYFNETKKGIMGL